jgi:F-type H+-transporting ATPase subunit epsilon
MFLEIITPEKKLYSGDAEIVKLPGTSGYFEIMLNHAPLVSTLIAGKIKVKDSKGVIAHFDIGGGVVEVVNNNVIVLIDSAAMS